MPGKKDGRKSRNCGTQAGSSGGIEKGIQVGTYPNPARKAVVMEKKEMFPKTCKTKEEVYLFMRFKKEFLQRVQNALVKEKSVVSNFGGRYIGLADNITRYEGNLYSGLAEQSFAIIEFKCMDLARRWTESSIIFKQKDFPSPSDEIEFFAIPVSYLPNEELCAFQLTEMHGLMVCPNEFEARYVNHVTKLMNRKHIYHGVVATHCMERLRNCMIRPNTFVLLNSADCESKLKSFYDSPDYCELRDYRQSHVSETDICIFTIRPVIEC